MVAVTQWKSLVLFNREEFVWLHGEITCTEEECTLCNQFHIGIFCEPWHVRFCYRWKISRRRQPTRFFFIHSALLLHILIPPIKSDPRNWNDCILINDSHVSWLRRTLIELCKVPFSLSLVDWTLILKKKEIIRSHFFSFQFFEFAFQSSRFKKQCLVHRFKILTSNHMKCQHFYDPRQTINLDEIILIYLLQTRESFTVALGQSYVFEVIRALETLQQQNHQLSSSVWDSRDHQHVFIRIRKVSTFPQLGQRWCHTSIATRRWWLIETKSNFDEKIQIKIEFIIIIIFF